MISIKPQTVDSSNLKIQSALQGLVFAGLGLLLIIGPLLRGLYYYLELMQAQMLFGVLCLLYGLLCFLRRDNPLQLRRRDYLVLFYAAVNLLSLFSAVHIKDAILGVVRVLDYLIVYFLVLDLTREISWRSRLVFILFISTVLTSAITLLATLELIPLPVPSGMVNKQLLSPLEYANAYAILAAVGVVLGCGLLEYYPALWAKGLMGIGIYLNALGVLHSQSRGTWILLGPVLVVYLLLKGRKGFWTRFYSWAGLVLVSLIAGKGYLDSLNGNNTQTGLFWLAGGLILAGLGCMLVYRVPYWLHYYRIKRHYSLVLPWILAFGLLVVAIYYFSYTAPIFPAAGGQLLSGSFIDQAKSIGGQDMSYQARINMNRLALQILCDHPLLGTGGGGWNALYHQYQEQFYWSSEVHNHFLQVGVETGFLGMFAFLGIWLSLLVQAARYFYKRKGDSSWPLALSVTLACTVLLLHSAIDFDLSIPALALVLWSMGAMLQNQLNVKSFRGRSFTIPAQYASILLVLLGVVSLSWGYREYRSQAFVRQGAQALQTGQYQQALAQYEKASELSPYTGETAANLTQLYAYMYATTQVKDYKTKAYTFAQRAVSLTPYYIPGSQKLAQAYSFLGDPKARRLEQERLVRIAPKMVTAWEALAQTYLNQGIGYLEKGDINPARTELEKCLSVMQTVEDNFIQAKKVGSMWPTYQLYLISGQAALLLGERPLAQEKLSLALHYQDPKNLAGIWLALSYLDTDERNYTHYYKQYVLNTPEGLSVFERAKNWYAVMNN